VSTTTASDPFNVTISIPRNRQWIQSVTLKALNGSPLNLSADTLALVIIPDLDAGDATPVLTNSTPTGDLVNGVAVFTFSDADTGTLIPSGSYRWQYLRKQSGNINSDVVVAGPLIVWDSPPFPHASS
jgi:hypothetical protein